MGKNPNITDDVKYRSIADEFRRRIVTGELAPGVRLPTRRELNTRFGAGPMTVQRALDRLQRDGFVVAHGRRGTFVSDRPPHLNHYALVMYTPYPQESLYLRALLQAAVEVTQSSDRRISTFLGIDGHSDVEDYRRLLGEIHHKRLAGIIFANAPLRLEDTPIVQEPGLPRIALMGGPNFGMPAMVFDPDAWMERAVEQLARLGCRRLAMFISPIAMDPTGPLEVEARFIAQVRARRLATRRQWIQFVNPVSAWTARRSTELLMSAKSRDERPDGLIIADDHLVEHVTRGLVSEQIRVPRELKVVAHCNWPLTPAAVAPVWFLGFDARQALRQCIAHLDAQRRGDSTAPSLLSPVSEDEIPAHRSPVGSYPILAGAH